MTNPHVPLDRNNAHADAFAALHKHLPAASFPNLAAAVTVCTDVDIQKYLQSLTDDQLVSTIIEALEFHGLSMSGVSAEAILPTQLLPQNGDSDLTDAIAEWFWDVEDHCVAELAIRRLARHSESHPALHHNRRQPHRGRRPSWPTERFKPIVTALAEPFTETDVVRHADCAYSQAHRAVGELLAEGFIVMDGSATSPRRGSRFRMTTRP